MNPRARVVMFKLAATIIEHLPEHFDVALARRLGMGLGGRSSGREHLTKNLGRVLASPSEAPNPELLDRYVRRGLANYGQYWAEGAKLPALSQRTITSRFTIAEGREYLDDAFANGSGVVIALPHVGSWEWGGSFIASLGMPMTAIAEELEPPELFEWFKSKREAIGIHIEGLNAQVSSKLLSVLKSGGSRWSPV